MLVRAAIEDFCRQQDHARTRAESGHPCGQPFTYWAEEARAFEEKRYCRRLPTRQDQSLSLGQLGWPPHLKGFGAQAPQKLDMLAKIPLERDNTNPPWRTAAQSLGHDLGAPFPYECCPYQPRSDSRVATPPDSSPRIASPRPLLTLATIS